jgi:hypothetical protein
LIVIGSALLSTKTLPVMDFIARGKLFAGLPESEGFPCHEPAARGLISGLIIGFVPHPLF